MAEYLLLIVPKEPILTRAQFQTIIDISVGIGHVILGSIVIPVIFEQWSVSTSFAGLTACLMFWYIAIRISRRIK